MKGSLCPVDENEKVEDEEGQVMIDESIVAVAVDCQENGTADSIEDVNPIGFPYSSQSSSPVRLMLGRRHNTFAHVINDISLLYSYMGDIRASV